MKESYIIYTNFSEFDMPYEGDIENHYQIHLLSVDGVLSWYFDPEEYQIDEVIAEAKKILAKLKKECKKGYNINV